MASAECGEPHNGLPAAQRISGSHVHEGDESYLESASAPHTSGYSLNPARGVAFYVTVDRRCASVLAVLALAVAAVGLVACDEAESVVISNQTPRTVVVYEDDVATELINPGLTQEFSTHEFRGTLTFAVRYLCDEDVCDQSVLGERTFTWDEMQQEGGITITLGAAALGEP